MEVDVRSRQRNRLVNTNYTSKKKTQKNGEFRSMARENARDREVGKRIQIKKCE